MWPLLLLLDEYSLPGSVGTAALGGRTGRKRHGRLRQLAYVRECVVRSRLSEPGKDCKDADGKIAQSNL